MAQSSIGTDAETSNIMKFVRARTQTETKLFMAEFGKALKVVLDSLEDTAKVLYVITPDMASHTITLKFGSILGYSDLPEEIQKQVDAVEKVQRLKEDGDGSNVVERTFEVTPEHMKNILKSKGENPFRKQTEKETEA